jgi:hypothetical protein
MDLPAGFFKGTDSTDRDNRLRFNTVLSLFLPMDYADH